MALRKSRLGAARSTYNSARANYSKALDTHIEGMQQFKPGAFWTGRDAYKAKKSLSAAKSNLASETRMAQDYYKKRKSSQN